MQENRDLIMARRIASAVHEEGGRTYFVGGCVRDWILGIENKDIDIEVHGIPAGKLKEILNTLGESTMYGASFGIMGLRHYGLDIAMPRTETPTGCGHRDFEVAVDPFLGEEKAARRRDFTMNALMQDVLTGEILDFFGGREDMAGRRIRHVDDRTFAEDPLRVFRAAQFAARFAFEVAEETIALSTGMDVSALSGERIMGELEKALLKAEHPSVFFEELRKMKKVRVWFPELLELYGVPQNPKFHPEGDVWTHTMQVLDEAASLREQASEPLYFMLSALCHDFGKAAVTEEIDGVIHAYGHEHAGVPLIERFLGRITTKVKLREYVVNMAELHMEPNIKMAAGSGIKSFMKTFDRSIVPEDLLLLARADYLGRIGLRETLTEEEYGDRRISAAADYAETEKKLRELLAIYRERMAAPFVQGRDLVEAGMKPGPLLGEALAYAHKLRLAGLTKEDQLRQVSGQFLRKQGSETGESPCSTDINNDRPQ